MLPLQNAKPAAKVKARPEEEENSAEGETSTGEDSADDAVSGGGGAESKADVDSNAADDEDMWDELQREARKENILETKSKETHPVHCPYFPTVRLCVNLSLSVLQSVCLSVLFLLCQVSL